MPGTLPSSTSHKHNIFFPLLFYFDSFYCSYLLFFLFMFPISLLYIYNKSKQNITYHIDRDGTFIVAVAFFMYTLLHILFFHSACSFLWTYVIWRARAASTRIMNKAEKKPIRLISHVISVYYTCGARC